MAEEAEMEKKSLFNDYEAYNEEATRISADLEKVIEPILTREASNGFSLRELTTIAHNLVAIIASERIILRAVAKKKDEREKRRQRAAK